MKGADLKRGIQIQNAIDASNKKISRLNEQITKKETERTTQQGKIDDIRNKYTSDEMPTTTVSSPIVSNTNRISDVREDDNPTTVSSPVVPNASRIEEPESRHAKQITSDLEHHQNEENEIRSATHAVPKNIEPHAEGHGARIASHEGEHGSPSVRTRLSSMRNHFRRKGGGKKTRKLQKG
jgi:predicted  nucleic acid-binding Zn-ribbon protein